MIRKLEEREYETVIELVNESWRVSYADYINPGVISELGCRMRAEEILGEFQAHRWEEYVWDEEGSPAALLSFGEAGDCDKEGDFEIRRIYIAKAAQGKGIGKKLLWFAEEQARQQGRKEIVIWAFKENFRALHFYLEAGFRMEKEEYLGDKYGIYAVRLIKTIG